MRETCPDCNYLKINCLCHAISKVATKTDVVVLQHPKESTHAKNTVKLLGNSIDKIRIFVGKNEDDFKAAATQLSADIKTTVVIYPNNKSTELKALTNNIAIERIILIDGSWKQAFGI